MRDGSLKGQNQISGLLAMGGADALGTGREGRARIRCNSGGKGIQGLVVH